MEGQMGNKVFESGKGNNATQAQPAPQKQSRDSSNYNPEKDVRPNEHPPGWNQD